MKKLTKLLIVLALSFGFIGCANSEEAAKESATKFLDALTTGDYETALQYSRKNAKDYVETYIEEADLIQEGLDNPEVGDDYKEVLKQLQTKLVDERFGEYVIKEPNVVSDKKIEIPIELEIINDEIIVDPTLETTYTNEQAKLILNLRDKDWVVSDIEDVYIYTYAYEIQNIINASTRSDEMKEIEEIVSNFLTNLETGDFSTAIEMTTDTGSNDVNNFMASLTSFDSYLEEGMVGDRGEEAIGRFATVMSQYLIDGHEIVQSLVFIDDIYEVQISEMAVTSESMDTALGIVDVEGWLNSNMDHFIEEYSSLSDEEIQDAIVAEIFDYLTDSLPQVVDQFAYEPTEVTIYIEKFDDGWKITDMF